MGGVGQRQTVQMYSLVQLTSTGLSTSLISATARLHACLRGAIDQDLNQVSDFCSTQRSKEYLMITPIVRKGKLELFGSLQRKLKKLAVHLEEIKVKSENNILKTVRKQNKLRFELGSTQAEAVRLQFY